MGKQGSATIKANFETGDIPTEAQFSDWIDSYENAVDVLHLLGLETVITAVTPPDKATATQLTVRYNVVQNGDAAGAGVKLTMAVINQVQTVYNNTGELLYVFPSSLETIRGFDPDDALELQPGEVVEFTGVGGSIMVADIKGSMVRTTDENLVITATTTNPTKATVPDIDAMSCIKTAKFNVLSFSLNYGKDGAQTGAAVGSGQYKFKLPDGQKFFPPALGFYSGSDDGKNFNIGNYAVGEVTSFAGGATGHSVFLVIPFDETTFRLVSQSLTQNGEYLNNVNWDLLQADLYYCFTFNSRVIAKF